MNKKMISEKKSDFISKMKEKFRKMIFIIVYTALKERKISKWHQIMLMTTCSIQLMHIPFRQEVKHNHNTNSNLE